MPVILLTHDNKNKKIFICFVLFSLIRTIDINVVGTFARQ
jgi:hypothetical protein